MPGSLERREDIYNIVLMTMTAWVNAIDSVKVRSGSYNMVYVLWEGIGKQFSRNQWKDTSGRTLGSGTFKFCSNSIFAQIMKRRIASHVLCAYG